MMPSRRVHLLPSMLIAAAMTACMSSPNPMLYTIASVTGPVQSAAPYVIALQEIGLAEYLQRLQIVRSSDGYRLEVLANDWWGEPLSAMLARVLVEEVGQRLPQSIVISEAGALTASPDVTVALNIQRLDEDATGAVILIAQASLEFRGKRAPILRNFRIAVPTNGTDVAAEVVAISTAIGRLADGLAAMLASGRIS
jgi:uncharacterized lipoprotein YmbA